MRHDIQTHEMSEYTDIKNELGFGITASVLSAITQLKIKIKYST
jgi:hypothetical protein